MRKRREKRRLNSVSGRWFQEARIEGELGQKDAERERERERRLDMKHCDTM